MPLTRLRAAYGVHTSDYILQTKWWYTVNHRVYTLRESNEAVNYSSVIHLYCIVYIMYFILYFVVDITHRKNVTRPFEDATSIVSTSN